MMTSLWFSVVFSVLAILMVGFALADVFWPITVGLVIGAVVVWWWSIVPAVVSFVTPVTVGAYVAMGFLWVFFKWTRLVDKAWRAGLSNYGSNHPEKMRPPQWSDHSWDFAAYFFYWPIDIIAYTLSDFLREIWKFISAMVSKSFNRYAEWRFARLASKQQ